MRSARKTIVQAVGLTLWAALAMTLGDWLWAALSLRHRAIYGLAHGALLCLWIGLYVGHLAGRRAAGALAGAAVGLAAAGSFYTLAPLMGYSAMFLSWMLLWFGLVAMAEWLTSARLSWGSWVVRALVAAIASAAAFYAVSGIWMRPDPTPNYAWHYAAWTIAFLPAALALLALRGTKNEEPKNEERRTKN
jgi:hypothetical protein